MATVAWYSAGNGRTSWKMAFVAGEQTVAVTKVVDGVRSAIDMPREAAVAFVNAQRTKGVKVRKTVTNDGFLTKTVAGGTLPPPESKVWAVYAPKAEAMPEYAAVAPAGFRGFRREASVNPHAGTDLGRAIDRALDDAEQAPTASRSGNAVKDGYYTVVRSDGSHKTYRVRTYDEGGMSGKTIMSFLRGPENDSEFNYTGCAFLVDGGRAVTWKKFRGTPGLESDLAAVVRDSKAAGQAFAKESGNCYRCGRLLTVPSSIDAGLGPVCAGRE